ncbi:type II toxin-antitoxin system RelE/ParE family toxin [Candidatus Shapirobacteria bacterium]|jgi:phage-related protein|nr:type II toxin-antitoxin system RelE/ParE family toxin [Candidatus Shapirobacteria bacterium]
MKSFFINSDIEKYLLSLDSSSVSKTIRIIELLEKYEYKLGMPYTKQIQKNLYELRIQGRQNIRLFYCFHQNKIVFVHAFIKKTNKTPSKEINTAIKRIKSLTHI